VWKVRTPWQWRVSWRAGKGIFCGISAGAAFSGAIDVSRRSAWGSTVLCLLPDTGERYQTTPLFDGISTDMSDEEQDIAASVEMPAASATASAPAPLPALMREQHTQEEGFLEVLLKDPAEPVVMFGLQWCEFSWSLRKFLLAQGISFRMIELDAVAFKAAADPALMRAALGKRAGSPTIPQLFVGGVSIGGCTDAFASWQRGQLQRQLHETGVSFLTEGPEPDAFLPGWMAGRHKMRAA
jgi:cysteine synthase